MTLGILGLARAKCVRCGTFLYAKDKWAAAEFLADHLREVHGPLRRPYRRGET